MESTLEPINPIQETPYGAIIIHNDILCTPTSLCTWSDGKPTPFCQLPVHTLNPVCEKPQKGIGLWGCYKEPTCGGLVPPEVTEKILRKKPHYRDIIKNEENKMKRKKNTVIKWDYALVVIIVLMGVLLFILLSWRHKTRRRHKRKLITNRSRMHSKTDKILSGVARTVRHGSR